MAAEAEAAAVETVDDELDLNMSADDRVDGRKSEATDVSMRPDARSALREPVGPSADEPVVAAVAAVAAAEDAVSGDGCGPDGSGVDDGEVKSDVVEEPARDVRLKAVVAVMIKGEVDRVFVDEGGVTPRSVEAGKGNDESWVEAAFPSRPPSPLDAVKGGILEVLAEGSTRPGLVAVVEAGGDV
jgi:hypothetical protein